MKLNMRTGKNSIFSRSLSGFLAFLMVFSILASLSLLPVFAADDSSSKKEGRVFSDIYTDYYTNPSYNEEKKYEQDKLDPRDFSSEQKRLAAMTLQYEKGDFQLYADTITGEVALYDKSTGDILFSNPYDVAEYATDSDLGTTSISKTVKPKLLSQVNIEYLSNNVGASYNSFTDAALLEQIDIKKLKGGVRIEYSIGEEEARLLIPRVMTQSRYQEMIIDQLEENLKDSNGNSVNIATNATAVKITAYYNMYKRDDIKKYPDERKEALYAKYPTLRDEDLAIFDEEATHRERKLVERYIKMYCPKYTFEEMDKDHRDNEYTVKDKAPANFRMALEYYITDNGLEVRFPANGLTFDETNYQLDAIKILPYMGAGVNDYNGYLFIPDGSGTLIRFEDVNKFDSIVGNVYGEDYAYQQIGNANREVFRMPVFGVVTTNEPMLKTELYKNEPTITDEMYEEMYTHDDRYYDYTTTDKDGNVTEHKGNYKTIKKYSTGYVAIITEGDALSKIVTESGASEDHPFNSVFCSFNPRPKDKYNLSDAISVGGDGSVTVVSKRKYTGSFRINYIMLTDPENNGVNNGGLGRTEGRTYYDASYVGMAKAYRDYLTKNGTIDKLTEAEVDANNIPLFIEAFGVTETEESRFSIPVTVKKALTSFDNLKTMVDELAAAKITNVNFKLTGYTNGGMLSTLPTKVKFEKVVGGKNGFREFLSYAAEKKIGVYPEFDFAYMTKTGMLDGFSYSSDAVKTIDNRYITKREYDAVLQTFGTAGKICISPCVFRDYFAKFNKSFTKVLGDNLTTSVSLSSLGSDINSDFDDDAPYNREDAKVFTVEMLSQFANDPKYTNIMIDAGNAYAMKYATVVLNAPLDSSRYENASEAIPFFGMVYHGYVVFAGAPTNMTGDVDYEMLKILENGATLYMMLSYDNVSLLKEDEYLSRYFAIDYQIWKDSLLTKYDEAGNVVSLGLYDKVNSALKGVQTSAINDHGFLYSHRKLTEMELTNIANRAQEEFDEQRAKWQFEIDKYNSQIANHKRVANNYFTEYGIYTVLALETIEDVLAAYNNDVFAAIDAAIVIAASDADLVASLNAAKTVLDLSLNNYGIKNLTAINTYLADVTAEYGKVNLDEIRNAIEDEYDDDIIIDDGSVVYVEYENGTWFVLNYNNFTIKTTVNGAEYEVLAKDFVQGTKANA